MHAALTAVAIYFAAVFFTIHVLTARHAGWLVGLISAWASILCLWAAVASFKRYLKGGK